MHIAPYRGGLGAELTVVGGSEVFAMEKKEIGDLAVS